LDNYQTIEIRQANEHDLKIILNFNLQMALETEGLELPSEVLRKGILAGLQNPDIALYFVAEIEGVIAGSLMITKEWSDWRNSWVAWIQSVYVKPNYRRRGIYTALYQHITNFVNQSDSFGGIRLYVDKTNENAIKTYKALGMNGEHYQLFEWMKKY
jgi:ribosomal protein S18 acetylase RimI-like enzyme